MKKYNKIVILGVVSSLMMYNTLPIYAEETSSSKEEVVYVMTDATGNVSNIYMVNIFSNPFGDDDTNYIDYGDYSNVKILNTNDVITQNEDKITFSSSSSKVYYQGDLENVQIPWDISIKYYLDGMEYSPKDIANKSGKLEIKFKISQNNECNSTFFENYALQCSLSLDTDICKNIVAENSTMANVGSKKQISYTILPNKCLDTSITADVTNFTMDSISINGIKLNLDIDVDDHEITDKISDLTNAIADIDDGAIELNNGSSDLKDGTSTLKDGSNDLNDGMENLNNGIISLNDSLKTIQNGLNTLNSQSDTLNNGSTEVKNALQTIQSALDNVSTDTSQLEELVSASGKIQTGISNLQTGAEQLKSNIGYLQYKAIMSQNGLDIDELQSMNKSTVESLSLQVKSLESTLSQIENVPEFQEQTVQLKTQIEQLNGIIKLLQGNIASIDGTQKYLEEVENYINDLYTGIVTLNSNYNDFNSAISSLYDTLNSMISNLEELSSGINTLATNYNTLDNGIHSYTNGVQQLVDGYSKLMNGMQQLSSGSKSLVTGANQLDNGISTLYDGMNTLNNGSSELSDGTTQLRNQTSDMDSQVQDTIDDMVQSIKGSDTETVSFVSPKNKDVKSVQFVIKTDSIEVPEDTSLVESSTEKLTLWQKFLNLFKR